MSIRAIRILPLLSMLLAAQAPAPDPAALARHTVDLLLVEKYPEFLAG